MKKWSLAFLLAVVLVGAGIYLLYPRPGPRYCWLVFGPDARTSALVCLRRQAVSIYHYADGKPTGRVEQCNGWSECAGVVIADPAGTTSYVITGISGPVVEARKPTELLIHVDIRGPVAYEQYCDVVEMADDPDRAPVAHFHGPLTVGAQTVSWRLPPGLALRRGDKPADVRAYVGTFDARKGCWVVVRSEPQIHYRFEHRRSAFPKGVHPYVDVEFPPKRLGEPPLKARYPLDQFC